MISIPDIRIISAHFLNAVTVIINRIVVVILHIPAVIPQLFIILDLILAQITELRIIQQRYHTFLIAHYRQMCAVLTIPQTLIAYIDRRQIHIIRILQHMRNVRSPLKRRISLHDISVESKLAAMSHKSSIIHSQCLITGRRFRKVNVIQPVTSGESIRTDAGHRISNPHFLQQRQISESSGSYRTDRTVLNRNALDLTTQIFIRETLRTDALNIKVTYLARDDNINALRTARIDQCAGNQFPVITGRITIPGTVITLQRHLIVSLAAAFIHIRNAFTIIPESFPCAASRECRSVSIQLRSIDTEIRIRHILE